MMDQDDIRELIETIRLEWCDVTEARSTYEEDDPMWAFYDKGRIEKIAQMAILEEVLNG